jgi:hypothetical protein
MTRMSSNDRLWQELMTLKTLTSRTRKGELTVEQCLRLIDQGVDGSLRILKNLEEQYKMKED